MPVPANLDGPTKTVSAPMGSLWRCTPYGRW